ncbi:MAG: DNA-binding response OmpR family regulator [Pirellulaceae bacterium]|jgi:DNA-binding response OmpR family regulator
MRILIVEDYAPVRNSVSRGLRESGFAVDDASDGENGLWMAESNSYDVVILDIMLPKVDGLTILSKLRQAQNPANILLLTARDSVEDRVQGLDAGADDYLVKPFAFSELLARVRSLVRRRYGAMDPVIRVADLSVDTNARSVSRGGKWIDLTAKEYALLEYLSQRVAETVTRTEIWEHLYDFHSESTSNVVDVYIGYLRRKLNTENQVNLIHTRRGQGYVLREPN